MSQQIQKVRSSKKTYKPLAQRPLAPKPSPLAQSPLAPNPIKSVPLAQSPLALRPISTPHLQSQNRFEMTPNPNNILMGYGTGTFMVPRPNIQYIEKNEVPFNTHVSEVNEHYLQENDGLFNEEIIPIDILDQDFGIKDLTVSTIF